MIFKIIFTIPLVCLTFLSSNESTTDEHIDTKNQSTQRYTNYYPHNNRDWNMAVSGSYLYWMIGTHTTFANVFSTTDERAVGNFKQYVFSESMNELIAGNPLYRSGFRVSAAIFNKKYEGWELGGEYQQINYKDCVLNCPRYFIPANWNFFEEDSFEAKFPIKANINNLTAKVNIGLPNMFGFHDETTDDIFGNRVTFLINSIEETFRYESALIGLKNKGIVHQSRYVNLGLNFGLELDWFYNSICMNGGNTFIHLGYDDFEDEGYAFLIPFETYFFRYKLSNKPFSIGPFFAVDAAFRYEKENHFFQLKGKLYGAGLYTKNAYKQDIATSENFYRIFEKGGSFPQSPCDIEFKGPQLCYNPKFSMYHAKVILGFDYAYELQNKAVGYVEVDWEVNSFLNFFDRDFVVYSHDDLNFQGLTLTLGLAF